MVPSSALGLHLHDREFRLCVDYWLGLKMSDGESKCPLCAGERVADPFGDHQVGCGGNGDRIHRHDSLRDSLFSAAQSAALAPRKEAPSLIPGSSSRPADIYLPNWCRGRPAALDVTVISTLQSLTLAEAVHNISRIGRHLGLRTGAQPSVSTRHLFQRLAISLWRGNATMWSQRLPTLPAWVDGII